MCHNFASLYDGIPVGEMREGGAYRKNVFATNVRWVYFCKQCRELFENAQSQRKLMSLQHRIEALEKQQSFRGKLKALRAAAH
jgi:hypothetical protein